jgi:hypothetical protein
VAAQHPAAFEAQQQVLASRLDRFQAAAVEPVGNPRRASAWVHGFNRQPLPDEGS